MITTEHCEVCNNNNVPPIGYGHQYCPDCGSLYYYDESVTLVLDSTQLRVVKIFSIVRAFIRHLTGIPIVKDWYYEMVEKPNHIAYEKAKNEALKKKCSLRHEL